MEDRRFLLVTFPAQGHINPSLQFAKRLANMGAKVTFSTSLAATRRMTGTASFPEGLTVLPFSDGYDNGYNKDVDDVRDFISSLIKHGSQAVIGLIQAEAIKGQPFTHVVYTTLMSWVGRVTHELQIPSTLLWIQPAALLDIYYYHFNGYGEVIPNSSSSSDAIQLPGLPLLTSSDLPSFLLASNPDVYNFALPAMKEHIEYLEKKENPKVLVNTFDALEPEALKSIKHLKLMGVGPLIPSAFSDGEDPSDTSFGGDLHKRAGINYVEWLNSKPDASVVFVAFGSFSDLSIKQMEEIARGLLESQKPFLWVIRPAPSGEKLEEKLSFKKELREQGLIVPWCTQVEVLTHPSVGCFVTHCGWNSTLESLASGVPMVSIPLWSDQTTNAKLVQDVWKTGKRASRNEEDIVESEELRKCLEIVMGSEETKSYARKWKGLAKDATREDGSSNINLKAFLDEAGAIITRHNF